VRAAKSTKKRRARSRGGKAKRAPKRTSRNPDTLTQAALDVLAQPLSRAASGNGPLRWNASPDDVQRSVMQLVLTLVEFIRKLLERQAIRRMEGGTLTKKETENVGLALMRLEETIKDLAAQFGLEPQDLNLDLGPVGKLM
jgi:hypothetical protein